MPLVPTLSNAPKPSGPMCSICSSRTIIRNIFGTGAIWIPASPTAQSILSKGTKELGVHAVALGRRPAGEALKLKSTRIALYDQYGGLMPSGWTRWIFEQFEFPFQVVYPQELDAGDLTKKFDVLVFTDGAIRAPGVTGRGEGSFGKQPSPEDIPAEFRPWLGRMTAEKTVPQIRQFVEAGGVTLSIGSSTSLGSYLDLPVASALIEHTAEGKDRPLPPEKYYIPGSLLTVSVN